MQSLNQLHAFGSEGKQELPSDTLQEELIYYWDILAKVNSNLFLYITNVIAWIIAKDLEMVI